MENKGSKKYDPYFCNVKLILIFLVILGHLMEKYIYTDHTLYVLYSIIYVVHMPLFTFVSGFFSKNSLRRFTQIWRVGGYFLIIHIGWLLINLLLTGEIGNWKCPYWYFWYLLSLFCWKWMGALLLYLEGRISNVKAKAFKVSILLVAIVIGCFSGAFPNIGRDFSLSRTLVLFPFYYMGLCCPKELIKRVKEIRLGILPILFVTVLSGSWLLNRIPVTFLYHTEGFKAFDLSLSLGIQARLVCYILATLLGLAILALTPDKQYAFSKLGINTMPVYILHGLLMPVNELAPANTLVSLLYYTVIIIGFIFLVFKITTYGKRQSYIMK